MAAEERNARDYEVRRINVGTAKSLSRTRALDFARPPSADEMRQRQNSIGELRRTVPVPDAQSRDEKRETEESELNEPPAEISED